MAGLPAVSGKGNRVAKGVSHFWVRHPLAVFLPEQKIAAGIVRVRVLDFIL